VAKKMFLVYFTFWFKYQRR